MLLRQKTLIPMRAADDIAERIIRAKEGSGYGS